MTLLLPDTPLELDQGNGANPLASIPIPTPEQITSLVDSHELYTEPLRQRMEADWNLLNLTPFDAGEDYQEYTSNEPMTYFAKMTSSLSSGKLKFRIPVAKARREKRENESAKERFIIGMLQANDERLLKLGEPTLLETVASFVNLRGWWCGRRMLVKDPNTGEVYADITPWDPLHVSWRMGPKGLKWICHKTKKTLAEVEEEYGIVADSPSANGDRPPVAAEGRPEAAAEWYFARQMSDDSGGVDVYDWYDEVYNIVVVNGKYAKPPTPHTPIQEVPAFFGAVGPLPLIQSRGFRGNINLTHQGESIFAANRRIYEKLNLVLSTMLQLVALSRNQAFSFTSRDGTKTVQKNPWLEGSQTPLAEGESIDILPLLEMSKDTGAFLGLLSAEIQRGALPYSVYGQLAFQLSGYAVNLLKQATDAPITPRKQAIENCYRQIANGICDQFATGAYGAMQLRGQDRNRDWFDEEFGPEMMVGLPAVEVTLGVKTPQDDMAKMQLAKLAGDGVWPVLPWRIIWDDILDMQDTDEIADAIKEQVGERMLPEAALMVLMQAMQKQGRPELAALYQGRLIKVAILDQQAPAPGGGQNGQGGSNGVSPENLSAPEQGAPTPQPTAQRGPVVPPGSPRPGASRPEGRP